MKRFILILFVLILLSGFIVSCSRLEPEHSYYRSSLDDSNVQTLVTLEVFVVSDGYAMGWDCLPDSLQDGEMRIDWEDMTESQRRGKCVVFAYYLDGPFEGRAYRPRRDKGGSYIVRGGKKVYLYVPEEGL